MVIEGTVMVIELKAMSNERRVMGFELTLLGFAKQVLVHEGSLKDMAGQLLAPFKGVGIFCIKQMRVVHF